MDEAAGASVYAAMASWFTPSYLFVFINLVIGTIAITTRFANTTEKHHQHQHQHLHRSPSLLERIASFNFRYHKHEQISTTPHDVVDPVQSLDSSQLERVPSLLDRVRSFSLDFTKVETKEPVEPVQNSDLLPLERAPSLLDRIRSFNLNFTEAQVEEHDEPVQQQLSRTSSLLDCVMSFNLGFIKTEVEKPDEPEPAQQQLRRAPSILQRIKSLTFERSESVKDSHEAEEREEEEGVDAKADDFINRFRQQLRLQRLDSILRYRDTLKRN
ncbi:pathogen-associated molecular patterns-induced protein A70 [Cajanus cajan]|uniref:DUF4408 domain-containing protein n=1 Tax=Cajanus cajan TaxID=3821 RepID=A0A151SWZ2_CAJCA|nr:pathogen-associated molecular patterns-induced protein A70 [Cajanus cajan]KYP59301.1 hypothetical protein KK1_014733 [Cajanus cajan]